MGMNLRDQKRTDVLRTGWAWRYLPELLNSHERITPATCCTGTARSAWEWRICGEPEGRAASGRQLGLAYEVFIRCFKALAWWHAVAAKRRRQVLSEAVPTNPPPAETVSYRMNSAGYGGGDGLKKRRQILLVDARIASARE